MYDSTWRREELVPRYQYLRQEGHNALQSGQLSLAERCFEEAVELARIFVLESREPKTLKALTNALSGLIAALDRMGANPETVPLREEAAELFRELANLSPEEGEAALAIALIRLAKAYRGATSYMDFGRPPMSTVAEMREYRHERLAQGTWGGLMPTFISPEEQAKAETPLREAITVLRRLVRTRRAEFEGQLALSLNLLGETLLRAEQLEQAEPPLREAEAMYRKLIIDQPDYLPMLTDTLSLLSQTQAVEAGPRDRVAILEELLPGVRAEAHITDDERENGVSQAKAAARDRWREVLEELADLYQEFGQDEKRAELWDGDLGILMSETLRIRRGPF